MDHGERIAALETDMRNLKEDIIKLCAQSESNGTWLKTIFGGVIVALVVLIFEMVTGHRVPPGI